VTHAVRKYQSSTWKRAVLKIKYQLFKRERVVLWHQSITPKVPFTSTLTGKAIISSPILHPKRALITTNLRRPEFSREKMERKSSLISTTSILINWWILTLLFLKTSKSKGSSVASLLRTNLEVFQSALLLLTSGTSSLDQRKRRPSIYATSIPSLSPSGYKHLMKVFLKHLTKGRFFLPNHMVDSTFALKHWWKDHSGIPYNTC
jgi:hypothetical protein